jgi:hypothetical protein
VPAAAAAPAPVVAAPGVPVAAVGAAAFAPTAFPQPPQNMLPSLNAAPQFAQNAIEIPPR